MARRFQKSVPLAFLNFTIQNFLLNIQHAIFETNTLKHE